MQTLLKLGGVLAVLILPFSPTFAATDEIQVYMDEMDKPGEFGLEMHNNYVFSGDTVPGYSGAQPPDHVYRMTPEFSYGLTDNFELGAYLLSSLDANRSANLDGAKLRLKYIAPKAQDQAYFWGANFELGSLANRISQNPTGAELKGIYGYRSGLWTFAINPNVDWFVSGPVAMPATFEIDTKMAYAIRPNYALGLESYNGLGSANGLVSPNQQIQELFAVVDTAVGGWDLNIGIGRGFSTFSDRWVAKAIIGVPFR